MARVSDNLRGALLMMAAMAGFTFNDACIKLIGDAMSLSQLLVMRGVLTSLIIGGLAYHLGALRLRLPRADWGLIILRSACEVAAAYFFISALRRMEIANVTAILQVLPLSVAVGAAVFFREPLGWRRISAILVGFLGMLLIVRPGPEGFTQESLFALAAVACVTVRDLAARRMSSGVPSLTVALVASVCVVLVGALAMVGETWQPVSAVNAVYLVLAAVLVGVAYLCSVAVMRVGEITFIAPFRYTSLLWALIIGFLVFGDWPDQLTLVGAAIVVGTGLFTLYREARARRQAPKARRT
jgi:S-adenosylmethionine uptake transporter